MAQLKQRDKSLWQKICDWFRDLAADLKALVDAYKGVKPDSNEGRMVAQMQDVIGKLEALYADALLEAGENFQAAEGQKNTTREGGLRYMSRDQKGNVIVDEDVDAQKVRKTLTDIYNGRYKSDNNYFPVLKNTPEVYKQYCYLDADRSFVMAKKKAYQAMQQKNKKQHALGVDGLMYVIENLGTPDYIVYQKVGEYAGNYAAIIISEQREIFAAVQLGEYKDAQYAPNGEKGYYNTLITAFYPNEGYIDDRILIPENDVVYDKNEDPLQVASGVTPSDRAEGSSKNSIRNPVQEVKIKFSDRDTNATYAEIEEERQKLFQRERDLLARKREAENNAELLQAMDDYSALFDEARSLFAKRRQGTATQKELDRIEEIKALREERLNRVSELQESLGLSAMEKEVYDIRAEKEALRIASDEAWAREGAEKENKAIEKAGVPAAEYFRKKAPKAFKTTTNFNEAGYLLPDGKLLNFSGGERNHRYRDHREIGEIYEATQGVAALNRFLSDGNIRIMAESPGIDLAAGVESTKEQYAALRRFINTNGVNDGQFFVDFSNTDGSRAGNYSYQGRVFADRIINDIKYFYENGSVREQSSVASFLSERDPEAERVNRGLEKENEKLREDVRELKGLVKLQKTVTGGTRFPRCWGIWQRPMQARRNLSRVMSAKPTRKMCTSIC